MGLLHKGLTAICETKKTVKNYYVRRRSPGRNRQKKIYIAGIKKCGSTSLEAFLRDGGFEVVREESIFGHWAGLQKYRLQYPDYRVLFVIREPVARIWSQYHYDRYRQAGKRNEIKCSFEEALSRHPGLVAASDYGRWIDRWGATNPAIVKLEELQKLPGFPKDNATEKNPIGPGEREMIIRACKKSGFDPAEYGRIRHDGSLFGG